MSEAEANNISKATAAYLGGTLTRAQAPFDYSWFLQLHHEMFGEVWEWAGRLRTSNTNIGIAPHLIEDKLYQLTENLPFWSDESLLRQAAMLHHQAVFIHPFENGNGRWSRTLANIWLHLHGHEVTLWPAQALSEESSMRDDYLRAVKAADLGDYGPLLSLHERFTTSDDE